VILLLVALLSISAKPVFGLRDSVDLIELNHFHDKQGRPVYDQVIFWEFDELKRLKVRAWCMADERLPIKSNASYCVEWKESGISRTITSRLFRESWTQTDPERDDKKRFDERDRVLLSQPIRGEQ
jgi:hypothetical protein